MSKMCFKNFGSFSTVIASWKLTNSPSTEGAGAFNFDIQAILSKMIDSAIDNAKGKDELSSLFTIGDILNVRLYYKAASVSTGPSSSSSSVGIEMVDDGSMLRTYLHSVLQLKSSRGKSNVNGADNIPAYTVVPVLGMCLSDEKESLLEETGTPLIAMQVTMADMMRMETEMWVRHNREYKYDN